MKKRIYKNGDSIKKDFGFIYIRSNIGFELKENKNFLGSRGSL